MIVFETTKKFKKSVKILDAKIKDQLFSRLRLFSENHENPILNIHPLKGNLAGIYSLSVSGDLRIHFKWQNKEKSKVLLIKVGTHGKLY